MIAITGATGQLGRLVITALTNKIPAADIVAIVRNVDKAKDIAALGVQVRQADYDQPASWDAALQGVEKLLLISSSEIGQRARQHRSVIEAASRGAVKLLAYTSVLHADTSVLGLAGEHRETEAAIKASGVPFVLLRNGWYTENYAMGIGAALSLGAVYGCAGDGRIASASRVDFAEAAAVVLTRDHQAGKVYELAGDAAYTLGEFAGEIAKQSGKPIPYVNLPEAEYKKALIGAGLPEPLAELLANSDTGVSKGALFDDGRQLSQLIGRPTTAWQTVVSAALN
ncbi:SDR family oxidoreductase [Paludibacterium purpuratum]|uniref:NAD(P)H dehydrogenase (Quinone) n=1 Tax=Paludibacterium purpuratum TaxID=1144873 RepID=A0A4R7BAD5_9NEIS|nr:SDR family oxidoreductase [Paludibacterium purpuratum]TDR81910.1 NAD(P)H dehydrogenase (quinone) [Paludibacterium purpuratum]